LFNPKETFMRHLTRIKTILLSATLVATSASATNYSDGSYYDYATVISSTPIVEVHRVNRPRQECREETVRRGYEGNDSYTGSVVGAIVGGVVGNKFGKGRGRTAATVAGSLLGASVGRDLSYEPREPRYVTETRCDTVNRYYEEEEVVGYRVRYRYRGQEYNTQTDERPGKTMRVRVNVTPETY
jgi:uncharacterized protein YcfJ